MIGFAPRAAASGIAAILTIALSLTASDVHAEPAYIAPGQIALSALIGPPPSVESEQQRRDLKAVLDAQAVRNDAQVERAKATADLSVFAFADVLGFHQDFNNALPLGGHCCPGGTQSYES